MLLVLLGIIALIYMICAGVKNNSAEKKYEAIKKYNDDYDRSWSSGSLRFVKSIITAALRERFPTTFLPANQGLRLRSELIQKT